MLSLLQAAQDVAPSVHRKGELYAAGAAVLANLVVITGLYIKSFKPSSNPGNTDALDTIGKDVRDVKTDVAVMKVNIEDLKDDVRGIRERELDAARKARLA